MKQREKYLTLVLVEIAARELLTAINDFHWTDRLPLQQEADHLRFLLARLDPIPASTTHS